MPSIPHSSIREMVRSVSGELPIEMVPACETGQLRGRHVPRWNCAARATRNLLSHRTLFDVSAGFGVWLRMALAALLCLLNLLGCHSSLRRCACACFDVLTSLPSRECVMTPGRFSCSTARRQRGIGVKLPKPVVQSSLGYTVLV